MARKASVAASKTGRSRAGSKARLTRSHNLVLVGVGGQGILLAGRILCEAAMKQGYAVNSFESHGMAQRGGAVINHIRWGTRVRSSLIMEGTADMLVALEPVEAVRRLPLLSERSTAVVNTKPIPPITLSSESGAKYPTTKQVSKLLQAHAGKLIALDGTLLAEQAGNPAVLSTVMIGAAWATGDLPLSKKRLLETIEEVVPERFIKQNLAAFEAGLGTVRAMTESK